MTYKELTKLIESLTDEQKKKEVIIYSIWEMEYFWVEKTAIETNEARGIVNQLILITEN